jgi:hypothetical protein
MKEQRRKAVLGMYPTRACVEIAVEAFCDAGFRAADISIVLPEKMTCDDFSAERATASTEVLPCDAAALIHLGIPEYETEDYAGKVLDGNALLSVHCDSPEKTLAARRLHGDLGGMDVFIAHGAERALDKTRSIAYSAGK